MQRNQRSWWGLYALVPLTVVLLYVSTKVNMGPALQQAMLLAIGVLAAALAWRWCEKHGDLIGSQGVNARSEQDSLQASGIEPGRLAPSVTVRQAEYRVAMFAHRSGPARDTPQEPS